MLKRSLCSIIFQNVICDLDEIYMSFGFLRSSMNNLDWKDRRAVRPVGTLSILKKETDHIAAASWNRWLSHAYLILWRNPIIYIPFMSLTIEILSGLKG